MLHEKVVQKKRNELRIKEEKQAKKARRAAQQEWEEKRLIEKMNEPPKPRKHICYHYIGRGGGIVVGSAATTLEPISDDKCRCYLCQTEFPIDYMYTMVELTNAYRYAGCTTVVDSKMALHRAIIPVEYIEESGGLSHSEKK